MIRYKEYVIDADSNCYTVGKLKVAENKKTGETKEYISQPKYCSSLSQAISIIAETIRREYVENHDVEFHQLTKDIKTLDDELRQALDFK